MNDVVKIVIGVAGGLILASIIWMVVVATIAHQAAKQINEQVQQSMTRIQQEAQKRADEVARQQREQQERKIAAQQEAMKMQQAAAQLAVEKNEAWKQFFKKSAECENPPTINAMGECANIEIRAKRKFEDQWRMSYSAR